MSTPPITDILTKLPVHTGIVWNGAGFEVTTPITLHTPLPTSRNPRVASENFASPYLYAIVSIAGRDVGPLSRNRAEEEVALLPGSVLSSAAGKRPAPVSPRLARPLLGKGGRHEYSADPEEHRHLPRRYEQ